MNKFLVVALIVALIAVVGWVKNIIKLIDCDFVAPYNCEVVHLIGLIPPVGAITGWVDIEEEETKK